MNKDEIPAGSYRVIENTVKLKPGFKMVKSKVRYLEIETTGNRDRYENLSAR